MGSERLASDERSRGDWRADYGSGGRAAGADAASHRELCRTHVRAVSNAIGKRLSSPSFQVLDLACKAWFRGASLRAP
eukprot:441227-Pleurochrysis_carterae.AAC.1